MPNLLRPALAGLLLFASCCAVSSQSELAGFSHDQALTYSQDVLGKPLADIQLINANGETVNITDYRGKPLVISLIFTSCHHICPATTRNLAEAVNKARAVLEDNSFQVLTVGFDTANDSPQRMDNFRLTNAVDDPHWDFLAADEHNIQALTRQLGFIYTPSSRGFDHLIQSSVVDADGQVYRQVYGIDFPTPVLVEALKALVFGQPTGISTLDYLQNRIRLFCTVYDPATDTYHIDISVFIGTGVGIIVSILFGWVLVREWRRSLQANKP